MGPRSDQAQHRSFTAQYRAEILAEYAAAPAAEPPRNSAEQLENAKLTARVVRVKRELARTEVAWRIEGKAHALLEMFFESADTDLGSKS